MTLKVERSVLADRLNTGNKREQSRLTPRILIRAHSQLVLPFIEIRRSESGAGLQLGHGLESRIILGMLNVTSLFDKQRC